MADKKQTKPNGVSGVITNVQLNWAQYLFKPDQGQYGSNKYNGVFLFDKTDTATFDAVSNLFVRSLKNGIQDGILDEKTVKDQVSRLRNNSDSADNTVFGWPLRDGDKEAAKDERNTMYQNKWYIRPTSNNKPRLYDRDAHEISDDDKARSLFHSGAIVNVNVYAFPYAPSRFVKHGGTGLWLNGVQFVAEGEHWGGGNPFQPITGTDTGTDADADDGDWNTI